MKSLQAIVLVSISGLYGFKASFSLIQLSEFFANPMNLGHYIDSAPKIAVNEVYIITYCLTFMSRIQCIC